MVGSPPSVSLFDLVLLCVNFAMIFHILRMSRLFSSTYLVIKKGLVRVVQDMTVSVWLYSIYIFRIMSLSLLRQKLQTSKTETSYHRTLGLVASLMDISKWLKVAETKTLFHVYVSFVTYLGR